MRGGYASPRGEDSGDHDGASSGRASPTGCSSTRLDPRAESYGLEAAEKLGLDPERVFKTARRHGGRRARLRRACSVAARLDSKAVGKRAHMADPADPGGADHGLRPRAARPYSAAASASRFCSTSRALGGHETIVLNAPAAAASRWSSRQTISSGSRAAGRRRSRRSGEPAALPRARRLVPTCSPGAPQDYEEEAGKIARLIRGRGARRAHAARVGLRRREQRSSHLKRPLRVHADRPVDGDAGRLARPERRVRACRGTRGRCGSAGRSTPSSSPMTRSST